MSKIQKNQLESEDPDFGKYLNFSAENTRLPPKEGIQAVSAARKTPDLDVLRDKLRQTEQQIRSNISDKASFSQDGDDPKQSELKKSASWKKLKEEEIKKLRSERLEKVRNQNPAQQEEFDTSKKYFYTENETSPSFKKVDEYNFKTLGFTSSSENNIDSNTKHVKNATAAFAGNQNFREQQEDRSIDIARDLIGDKYSKNKSFSSISQVEDDKYLQVKFYKRHHEKELATRLMLEKVEEDRKKLANSKKMTQGSYKIMIKKLESVLTSILMEIDPEGTKKINFQQLGRVFTLLSLFRIIQYDENYNLENEDQFYSSTSKDQKRRYDEMMMHEQIWNILSIDEESEFVDTEFTYIIFRILLDPANLSHEETAQLLDEYVSKYKDLGDSENDVPIPQDEPLEKWPTVQLVKSFRRLNENRLAYTKTGYLKPDKVEDITAKDKEYTFKPKINELSEAIERYHTERFLKENPIDLEPESSKQQPSEGNRNVKKLLSDIEGILGNGRSKTPENTGSGEIGTGSVMEHSKSKDDLAKTRVKLIYKKQELVEKKIEENRKKKEVESMKDCTFQPSTNVSKMNTIKSEKPEVSERLYNHHKLQKKKEEERLMEQIERETKEWESCTFKPEINNFPNPAIPKNVPKGFEKSIVRMRAAGEETKKKKEALEKIPVGENYEKLRNAKIAPPSFVNEPKLKKKPPFVYIDANIGHGKTGRIGIHEDDDPHVLARNFAITFQLTEDVQNDLENLIAQQLEDYYAKQEQNYYKD